MPIPNYQNGVIYKLCHQDDLNNNNICVGSTTNFRIRKNNHKSKCNNENCKEYNYPVYKYIRANGNWNEWVMIPIEVYPCNSKKELEIRERYYIELLKSKLNQFIPTRSQKDRYQDNKKIINEKHKQYRIDNKEILNEKKKEKVICDHCGCEITKNHISRHKNTKKCKNYNITKE